MAVDLKNELVLSNEIHFIVMKQTPGFCSLTLSCMNIELQNVTGMTAGAFVDE